MLRRFPNRTAIRALVVLAVAVPVSAVGPVAPTGVSPAAAAATSPPDNTWGFDGVTTAAGTGSAAFGGDGGPANQASLREPGDVAVSGDGTTWYVADTWNNRIRAVDTTTGVITTVAGSGGQCQRAQNPDDGCGDGGPATAATLNHPGGIALGGNGALLYIVDTNANLVRVVTMSTGVITTVAGTGTEGGAGDGGPATAAQLAGPSGVAVTPDGDVYVADTFNNRVRRISNGTIIAYAGTGDPCANPSAPCGDGGQAASAQLSGPVGVSGPDAGNAMVVADTGDNRIRRVTPDGVITTEAGTGIGGNSGDAGPALAAQLNQPQRAVVAKGGVMYVVDTANHRIRAVMQDTIFPVAGTGSAANGPSGQPSWATGLDSPRGLAVTAAGVLIADTANQVVRAMTAAHVRLTYTICGANASTPGGRFTTEIPVAGLPTPSFASADVSGGEGGGGIYMGSSGASGGAGGYAHQTWQIDPTAVRLFAAVGCGGGDGGGDGLNAGGGGGGGASAIAAMDSTGEHPLVIAGGGGGAGGVVSPCQVSLNSLPGYPAGTDAQAHGDGPIAASGGGGGKGGVFPSNPTTQSGADGYGGPGGEGGYYAGGGGWGAGFPDTTSGSGGRGATTSAPGDGNGPCAATGGGGGGWGGGASGDSATTMGGSGGGNYGSCSDATQGSPNFGDGSIVVDITTKAAASCTPSLGEAGDDAVRARRDSAFAKTWSAVHAIGDAQTRQRLLPPPQTPRVAAASTAFAPDCPTAMGGAGQQPGDGQAMFYAGTSPTGQSLLVDTGSWDEANCPILEGFATVGYVALGPGVAVRAVSRTGAVTVATQSGPVTMSGPFSSGAVLEAIDFLKLFNECPGCDLTGADLAGLTFPPQANLAGATLSGSTIYNTDLEEAVLTDATFGVDGDGDPAVVSDSSLQGAHVERTVFEQTVFRAAGFQQASFRCASFSNTVVLEASFDDATWSSPSCTRPTFDGAVLAMRTVPPADWSDVSFKSSAIVVDPTTRSAAKGITLSQWSFVGSRFVGLPPDLSGITVTGATLDGSSLFLADLTGATFNEPTSIQGTVFVDATLAEAKFPGAIAHGAVFTGADLEDAVFDGAKLGTGSDPSALLPTATFRNADAHGASFADVEARGVEFNGAYLYPGDHVVSFDDAILGGATFNGAVLGQTSFTNITAATTGGALRFDGAQCVNCDFTGAHMEDVHFDSAYIYGASFKGATMANAVFVNAACCGSGTWSYSLGTGAAAASEPYASDPVAPFLSGPEFDNISLCPSGSPPSPSNGCRDQTTPGQPPPQPQCVAAAEHECALEIASLAGTGVAGYSDGGPQQDAMLAAFDSPSDVAFDPVSGAVIVADTVNRVVRRISQVSSTAPHISVVAGSPPTSGRPQVGSPPPRRTRPRPGAVPAVPGLIAPSGVATTVVGTTDTIGIADKASNIVFTTTGTNTPRPLAGTGTPCAAPTTPCGDGGLASRAQLNQPNGIWFDPTGSLYIADTGDNRIRKVDPSGGAITTVAGTGTAGDTGEGGPANAAELKGPTDVVGDQLGNLYVADAGNAAIRRIDPSGNITLLAGDDGSLTNPTSITVDGRNRLYLTDAGANVVQTLNLFGVANPIAGTGTAGYSGDGGPAALAELNGPLGVAAVGDGALFLADSANDRIRSVQPGSSDAVPPGG